MSFLDCWRMELNGGEVRGKVLVVDGVSMISDHQMDELTWRAARSLRAQVSDLAHAHYRNRLRNHSAVSWGSRRTSAPMW